ncbi:hypothetical protein G3I40_04110 [Streptomyces sp. SID14478]|uniref:hypothetical protein n=1 Tax=Streptomyces sp. SID14478 TaxID=2706073 RepID=UPI0013DC52FA|nr:hypothetical protein [Streptomyces sp. SID14478]NEB74418.1 hypothetical protein [Streptomyces sp. SID14478]
MTLPVVVVVSEAVASAVTLAMGWLAALRGYRRYLITFIIWALLFLVVPNTSWFAVALSWAFGAAAASFLATMNRADPGSGRNPL